MHELLLTYTEHTQISSKLLQSVCTAGILFASKEQVFRAVKLVLDGQKA